MSGSETIRFGINGFGRIGRLVCRASQPFENLQLVAVNDPFITVKYAAYLLAHDSVHGRFIGDVEVDEEANALIVNGTTVRFFSERNPAVRAAPQAPAGCAPPTGASRARSAFSGSAR